MKKTKITLLLTIFTLLMSMGIATAQQISPFVFGQNAWMPDSIGTRKYNGGLEANWAPIGESGAKIMRYGGIGVDQNNPTNYQYVKMIDAMRAKGIEPMVQVPFHNWQFSAQHAADIVQYVNITKGKNVKYWVIGNEPDLGYSFTSSSQVAPYIKAFASAMKAVDPTIKIIGPECAWYNEGIINGLTTPGGPDDITGKDANGRYYVDYISFHAYPMQAGSTSRPSIIGNLTETGKFQDNLTALNSRLATCNQANGRTGGAELKVAVTEININYKNPAGDNLWGTGASSFLGGQYWAEVLGIAMKKGVAILNFWSVIEGSSDEENIGFLNRGDNSKKPSYYHFQMMSQNFKGTYADATDNQPNVKSFGSKDGSQVAVMIMNQDAASNFNYTVRLNGDNITGTSALKINVSAGIAASYTGTIENQSTLVLVFDVAGNIIKKIEYKLNGNASSNLPPTVTNLGTAANGNGNTNGNNNNNNNNNQTGAGNDSTGTATGVNTPPVQDIFEVKVGPNPSNEHFGFKITTSHLEPITVRMYDMAGRLCVEENNLTPNETVKLGETLASGQYIAQVEQGDKKQTVKLIKSN